MTDDPSLVETSTLAASAKRDLFEAQRLLRQAFDWLGHAQTALTELERREARKLGPSTQAGERA